MVNLNINWSSLTYVSGEAIKAAIRLRDATGVPPTDLAWTLYRNGVPVGTGSSQELSFQTSSPGLYRLKATAGAGSLSADSAVTVGAGFEIQASPLPPEMEPTAIYLGALYCDELIGSGGETLARPYQLACFSQEIFLLPGTTHVSFDLDPSQNTVDDEVVVRTATGNYLLKGFPVGLLDEAVGYDYTGGQPVVAAPANGILRLSVEAFNVHGDVASAFSFRVRVKCWRQGQALYQYIRCPFTSFPGGRGKRDRQFAALFTELDVETDVNSGLNRLNSTEVNRYTAPEVSTMPLTVLATDGAPDPVQSPTGMFFTDSNWYAVYEPDSNELPELNAKAISGHGFRPFYFTLEEPASPPIIQRVKRLGGKMVVYMSQGALTKGAVLTARVQTSKLYGGVDEVSYTIPITADVYNNRTDVFQKITSIEIDLDDFAFSDNGVVVFFDLDESAADPDPLPCDDPDPAKPDAYLYTSIKANGVIFDGACYTNPVVQPTVAAASNPVPGGIAGCHELVCGPVGLYCYTDVATGLRSASFRQPLYFPAPFVAYGSEPLDCFAEPLLLSEETGTVYQQFDIVPQEGYCGDGYVYRECDGLNSILTVYPHNTVPHDVISYGSECWSRQTGAVSGSFANVILDEYQWPLISAGSVSAVADCNDDPCNVANGDSVVYTDTQTAQRLPVFFEGLQYGVPHVGASPQISDSGLGNMPRGQMNVTFSRPRVALFTAAQGGQIDVNLGLSGFAKRVVVIRGGQTLRFEIGLGNTARILDLQAGDQVFADIGNAVGILSDRTRNTRTLVRWNPIISLPRVFDRVTLDVTGPNVITALGFTGLTNRSSYTLLSPLPKDIEQELPNPDNLVTVEAGGAEYTLVRTRAVGDPTPGIPGSAPWYAGQALSGPLTFKFWTSREDAGSHGEMDVWLSTDAGSFPIYFKVDSFRSLSRKTPLRRVDHVLGDISRNALRVASDGTTFHWPYRYVAGDGERITAFVNAGTVTYADKTFLQVGPDPGISSSIKNASPSS